MILLSAYKVGNEYALFAGFEILKSKKCAYPLNSNTNEKQLIVSCQDLLLITKYNHN
jgi:hypothetical protein